MPEIPEMSIILTRGIDGSVFSDGLDRSEEGLENSERNERFQKRFEKEFGEKSGIGSTREGGKKAVRWVGLGYRKDIGMMNE